MNTGLARSYNDRQLDTISRSVYFKTAEFATAYLKRDSVIDPEMLHALAASLEAAACGFEDAEELDPDVPAGMRQTTPYNDDLLNEMSRTIYVECVQKVQAFMNLTLTLNVELLHGYARLADAAAAGFHEDEEDDE